MSAEIFVGFLRPRITLIIAARFKLKWINKNAYCHFAIPPRVLPRGANEFPMRLVQCAHRWHKHAALRGLFSRNIRHLRDNLHAETIMQSAPAREPRMLSRRRPVGSF